MRPFVFMPEISVICNKRHYIQSSENTSRSHILFLSILLCQKINLHILLIESWAQWKQCRVRIFPTRSINWRTCICLFLPEMFVAVKQPLKECCSCSEMPNYEDRFPNWNLFISRNDKKKHQTRYLNHLNVFFHVFIRQLPFTVFFSVYLTGG